MGWNRLDFTDKLQWVIFAIIMLFVCTSAIHHGLTCHEEHEPVEWDCNPRSGSC